MKTRADVIGSGSERVRAGPWQGDDGVAFLAPASDVPALSTRFVASCVDELAGKGYSSVITAALPPAQRRPFLLAGFEEHERLLLLSHDLRQLPSPKRGLVERPRGLDRDRVLEIDTATFSRFWHLDDQGLDQAIRATPSARFRIAREGERVAGYAITGLDHSEGYMQRLAVAPEWQRHGVGSTLALDGLHWLRRRRARRALVNTQTDNVAATTLYLALGFRVETSDLVVLRRDIA